MLGLIIRVPNAHFLEIITQSGEKKILISNLNSYSLSYQSNQLIKLPRICRTSYKKSFNCEKQVLSFIYWESVKPIKP
jgi:hypothetical protein